VTGSLNNEDNILWTQLVELHSNLFKKPQISEANDEKQKKLVSLYSFSYEPKGTARRVLDAYYQEPPLDPLEDPLLWWKSKKNSYAALAKIV